MFKNPWLTGISLLFVFSSCSSVYMPNVPNTPMLTKAGEFHGGGHISLKGNISANTAYAISDHVAIMANGSIMDNNHRKKDFKQILLEGGIGYFDTFGPDKRRILEVYAGYGIGNTDRTYKDQTYVGPVITDVQEVSFNKFFMQVNYSAKKKKDLRLFGHKYPLNYGTALRISHVGMQDFTRNGVSQPLEDNIFLEPIFFTRMYISKTAQLQYTSGSTFGLINRDYLTAGNSVFTIGVVFNVGGANGK